MSLEIVAGCAQWTLTLNEDFYSHYTMLRIKVPKSKR